MDSSPRIHDFDSPFGEKLICDWQEELKSSIASFVKRRRSFLVRGVLLSAHWKAVFTMSIFRIAQDRRLTYFSLKNSHFMNTTGMFCGLPRHHIEVTLLTLDIERFHFVATLLKEVLLNRYSSTASLSLHSSIMMLCSSAVDAVVTIICISSSPLPLCWKL